MAGGDVADLVPEDTGQLVLRAHQGQQAAGDVDVTPGSGESIDDRAVQDREMKGQVGPVGARGHSRPRGRDVGFERRVGINPEFRPDLGVGLLADLDLLRFGDETQLFLARDRIHGARGDKQGR